MSSPTHVILRYFDIRGRAQPLRDALIDAAIPFEDERIPLGAGWRTMKEQPAGGPFGSLPVLEWGLDCVAQTLAIASYVSRRLGQYDGLDAMGIACLEMVASAAYLDIIGQLGLMMRPAAPLTPETETAFFTDHASRAVHKVERLERMHASRPHPFFGGEHPAVADFFVLEAIDMGHALLGARFEETMRSCPRLTEMAAALSSRPAIADYLAGGGRPERLTGSPLEAQVRERLRGFVERGA